MARGAESQVDGMRLRVARWQDAEGGDAMGRIVWLFEIS